MQSYPPRVLDRRLQEAWARATKDGLRVLMNLRVDFSAHGSRLDPLFFVNIRIGFFLLLGLVFWPFLQYRVLALYFWAF